MQYISVLNLLNKCKEQNHLENIGMTYLNLSSSESIWSETNLAYKSILAEEERSSYQEASCTAQDKGLVEWEQASDQGASDWGKRAIR